MHKEFSVAMPEEVGRHLAAHLIRQDREEDLCFALWTPSYGDVRVTALLHTIVLPKSGDRQRHGNASFNTQYFERVCAEAIDAGRGIAFLHSHPGPGWQAMSKDDIAAELKLAGASLGLTGLPLVGLTVGSDEAWSARFWVREGRKKFERRWCRVVRVVGNQLATTFSDDLAPRPRFGEAFKRTISVWGPDNHAKLARLRIGIVGLGSVGSLIAETLARSGFENVVLIDFDEIQLHNIDRLVGATLADIGRLKVEQTKERMAEIATAETISVVAVPFSISEKEGYAAALDCDVIFLCVDRPRARQILNHFAYAHLIPVIDGGIAVRFKHGIFSGVDWQLQTVGPGRPCLDCLGAFTPSDASTEIAGMLDDPSYLSGLEDGHHLKRNENIFAFSENLASLEFFQLIALATALGGMNDFGVQRFRYVPGMIDEMDVQGCRSTCHSAELIAVGDKYFSLMGQDVTAKQLAYDRRPAFRSVYRQPIRRMQRNVRLTIASLVSILSFKFHLSDASRRSWFHVSSAAHGGIKPTHRSCAQQWKKPAIARGPSDY